jgi:Undecaprenyl-phosphate glucose phosphotransferase
MKAMDRRALITGVGPSARSIGADFEPGLRLSFSSHVVPGLIAALDTAMIMSVALVSFFALVGQYVEDVSYYGAAIAFVWITTILLLHFAGLYHLEAILRPLAFSDKILIAFATTFLFLLAAAFSLKVSATFSRVWVASFGAAACSATMLARFFASRVVAHLASRGVFTRNVVIAGAGDQVRRLLAHMDTSQPQFIRVLGIFSDEPSAARDHFGRYPFLGGLDNLKAHVRTNTVDDVVIALPWSADEQIVTMMAKLRELPVNVYLGADLIGFRLPFRQPPDHFGDLPLVEVMGRPLAGWGGLRKAALDYGLGLTLTVLLLPFMALIALAIKLDSGGAMLFRQERYGFVNRVFRIWKFRTMRPAAVPSKGTPQATRDDPRVTRIGRFLRRTSLDELPQLFNVLTGTMSLVGPRPHAIDHNEEYSQLIRGYFARHCVKPGITGWAQVNGLRGETKTVELMEARVKYDIYYVENWNLLFDLKILLMTVVTALRGRNAY